MVVVGIRVLLWHASNLCRRCLWRWRVNRPRDIPPKQLTTLKAINNPRFHKKSHETILRNIFFSSQVGHPVIPSRPLACRWTRSPSGPWSQPLPKRRNPKRPKRTSGDNQINQFHEKKQENTRNMVTILSPSKGSKSMTTAIINSTVWLSMVL